LRRRQRRRRSAAEEDRFQLQRKTLPDVFYLSQQRLAKALRLRTVGALLVKSAVRTNPGAEWNMDIEMRDGGRAFATANSSFGELDVFPIPHKLVLILHRADSNLSLFSHLRLRPRADDPCPI